MLRFSGYYSVVCFSVSQFDLNLILGLLSETIAVLIMQALLLFPAYFLFVCCCWCCLFVLLVSHLCVRLILVSFCLFSLRFATDLFFYYTTTYVSYTDTKTAHSTSANTGTTSVT